MSGCCMGPGLHGTWLALTVNFQDAHRGVRKKETALGSSSVQPLPAYFNPRA